MTTDILIRQTRFTQPVRLGHLPDGPAMTFVDCVFEKGLCARDAAVAGSLMFVGCRFGRLDEEGASDIAVDFENTRLTGDLTLYGCKIGGRVFAPSLRSTSDVRLRGCMVAPDLGAIGAPLRFNEIATGAGEVGDLLGKLLDRIEWKPAPFDRVSAICFDGAAIDGDLDIGVAAGELHRTSSADEALLDAGHTGDAAASVVLGSISGVGLRVGGSLNLFGTLCRGGGLDLRRAVCEGNVACYADVARSTSLPHFRASYLQATDARIEGDVDLRSVELESNVSLYGAAISGNLTMLGLHAGGSLALTFSRINGFVTAFRTSDYRATGRRALLIGGDLTLSGCDIRSVELRGIEVTGLIESLTGKFGRLFLTAGVEPDDDNKQFWPKPSRAASVFLSAITVEENVDVAGFQLLPRDEKPMREGSRRLQSTSGFTLTGSRIGKDLDFYVGNVALALERRWGTDVAWRGGVKPTPGDGEGRIRGDLDLQANTIEGKLDLRSLNVEAAVRLNDTTVRLDVELGSEHDVFDFKETGMTTVCGYLDAEKLRSDGDLNLTGLRVRRRGGWAGADVTKISGNAGSVSARGAHIQGEILLIPRDKRRRSPPAGAAPAGSGDGSDEVPGCACIENRLDLTAAEASHLVLSRVNFPVTADETPAIQPDGTAPDARDARISLERGTFGRLEIVKPPPDEIDLSRVTVDRWQFGEDRVPTAKDYIAVLQNMKPFDRSTWISVETELRNQMAEDDANQVYRAMRWSARQLRPDQRSWTLWARAAAIPVLAMAALWLGVQRGYMQLAPVQILLTLVFSLIPAWAFFDRETMYGRLLGFGTRAWWPMVPALGLFFVSWLLVFSHAQNVRASADLLQTFDLTASRPPGDAGNRTPLDLSPGEWDWEDALALTIRYHVPIVPSLTHARWEASAHRLRYLGISAEQYALWLTVYHWIAWPLFLIWLAARVVRGRQT